MNRSAGVAAFALLVAGNVHADWRPDSQDAGAAAVAEVEMYEFDVYLDDKRIGSHTWHVRERASGEREVYSEADFEVRLMFLTVFDYEHRSTEQWRDGCLARITAETIRNGDRLGVSGRQSREGFVVAAGTEERSLPGCVMTFAYWNPQFLAQERLLNPQTGQFEPVDVERAAADGGNRRTGWVVRAEGLEVTVWYDAGSRWVGLEAPTRGGRTLRYVQS